MGKFFREFVSMEKRSYAMKLGNFTASSLAGFVAGAVVASLIWYTIIYVVNHSGF